MNPYTVRRVWGLGFAEGIEENMPLPWGWLFSD